MTLAFFFKGIIIGFSIAAPVGPIGILTVHRSLHHGTWAGLCTGMGAATADAVYGCTAAFGLTFISSALLSWNTWLLRAGGLFLMGMGLVLLRRAPQVSSPSSPAGFTTYPSAYLSSFLLTLTNPMTIMAFTVIFAGLGLGMTGENYLSAALLVLGVFSGSSAWWFFLAFGVGRLKGKFSRRLMLWLNRGAGLILLGFGLWSVLFAGTHA